MRHSIFTRLTLFFIVILTGISIGFYFLVEDVSRQNVKTEIKESDIMMMMLRRSILFPQQKRVAFFKERGYVYLPVTPQNTKGLIPAFVTIPDNFTPEIKSSMKEGIIAIKKSKTMLYILINRKKEPFMVGRNVVNPYMSWLWIGFSTLILLIVALYFSLIHSLLPLKKLANAIKSYGENGSYTPEISNKKDEIAYLINAFDVAVKNNRALLDGRHLFMRNVMHELKTPITVGKLSLPFLGASRESEILGRAFVRMERLIEDMAHIEEVTSLSTQTNMTSCSISSLIEKAEALMLETQGIVVCNIIQNCHLLADERMMVSVFKNLIDNALKYSPDKQVDIALEDGKLIFSNRGEAWSDSQSFETLLEPFVYQDTSTTKRSFGLGLYIVKSILETHKINFSYFYEEEHHHFVLENIILDGCV